MRGLGEIRGLAVVLLLMAGCGTPTSTLPATVQGVVTFQGRPLVGGLVVFVPDRDKGMNGPPISALIDHEGRYTLASEGAGTVMPGWYRVAIAEPGGMPGPELGYPRFPAALRRPDRSGLEREILPGQVHEMNFAIEVPVL